MSVVSALFNLIDLETFNLIKEVIEFNIRDYCGSNLNTMGGSSDEQNKDYIHSIGGVIS
jgi:hypothetical protein